MQEDTYWCFMMLLSDFRDNFVKTLDDSDCGIGSLMARLEALLKECDPEVSVSPDSSSRCFP